MRRPPIVIPDLRSMDNISASQRGPNAHHAIANRTKVNSTLVVEISGPRPRHRTHSDVLASALCLNDHVSGPPSCEHRLHAAYCFNSGLRRSRVFDAPQTRNHKRWPATQAHLRRPMYDGIRALGAFTHTHLSLNALPWASSRPSADRWRDAQNKICTYEKTRVAIDNAARQRRRACEAGRAWRHKWSEEGGSAGSMSHTW